jgi:hypothetical protein
VPFSCACPELVKGQSPDEIGATTKIREKGRFYTKLCRGLYFMFYAGTSQSLLLKRLLGIDSVGIPKPSDDGVICPIYPAELQPMSVTGKFF